MKDTGPYNHPSTMVAMKACEFGRWSALARQWSSDARFAPDPQIKRTRRKAARDFAQHAREAYAAMLQEMERTDV